MLRKQNFLNFFFTIEAVTSYNWNIAFIRLLAPRLSYNIEGEEIFHYGHKKMVI